MKKGVKLVLAVQKIMELASQMKGVFSSADLANIIKGRSDLYNQRAIRSLTQLGIISRVLRGLYITKNFDLWTLAVRINEKSYISMDSVLAKLGLTGSIPEKSLSVVHCGPKKTIKTPAGNINFYSISPELYFGFSRQNSGVNVAEPEKAFIDMLYFYVKGARFLIDPVNDVDISKLNSKKILTYLRHYKNPKFVNFVKRCLL